MAFEKINKKVKKVGLKHLVILFQEGSGMVGFDGVEAREEGFVGFEVVNFCLGEKFELGSGKFFVLPDN